MDNIKKYAKSLVGIKYIWWKSGSTCDPIYPFYVDKKPSRSYIKQNGINCAGFINLLRQKAGFEVPGTGKYRGGTASWFFYLKRKKF